MLKTKINTILLCTLFTLFFPLSAGAQYRARYVGVSRR